MRAKQVLVFIFFSVFLRTIYAQNITKLDSAKLLNCWNKTSLYILSRDTLKLRGLCLDSVDCTLCGFHNDTIVDYIKPIDYFLKNGLTKLIGNKKLWKIISSNKPDIMVTGFIDKHGRGENVYGIAYDYYKPNELAKNHEGIQVVFYYVIRQGNFKLTAISLVP